MGEEMFVIDTSSFQGRVDYAATRAVCKGGWGKVTEGTGYANPYWPDDKAQMKALAGPDYVPGAYPFVRQGLGAAQADWFAENAGDLDGFGIFVDVEPAPGSRPTMADAVACVERLRVHYPQHPIGGYLPPWYWGDADTTFVDWLFPSRYVAGIGSPARLYAEVPASYWAPYGGRSPSLLQFTSSAVVPGVQGTVDCSAFRGTAAQYAAMVLPAGPKPKPPPPPPLKDWQVRMMRGLPLLTAGSPDHADVRRAQSLLGAAGAAVTVDGIFGPVTDAAVRRVQHAHGLPVDGKVGEHTWCVLVTGADL